MEEFFKNKTYIYDHKWKHQSTFKQTCILRTFQIVWQQLVFEILEFVGFAAFQSDWWLKEMDWPLAHEIFI